ncbi:CRISPR-associated autoregulator DevR family [Halobacteroides halobius DSM 5150]|uniref:CRISPR-associated autoregulator DevR family n=1 Tax=Halobacteroides halobius (strain ATCC 35273 / DSM 5150 / MD-1) TaxID=748449 RepID=L0K8Q5_HALHC|nr:DevR family CRISPR-associated autoregulator [Halobacteroides halobius]AGB40920.1 CRISPR-associated autoregulator DevR family [Halobacteroides halobius DSM 5150]
MSKEVYSISINGKVGLNLHDLNNEKSEGNQLTTRNVTITDGAGKLATVNAVSGDMLKHIQSSHLYKTAKENEDLPLCQGCEKFDANRITIDDDFDEFTKDSDNTKTDIVDEMLSRCVLDDMEGILVTNNKKNVGRDSTVEFGWLVAIPEEFNSENLFHVKYSDLEKSEGSGKNEGQNIFYRPVNSGQYAVVNNLEISRIGYNDISKEYALDKEDIETRYKALLKSIMLTYYSPEGAMRNTQAPHMTSFEGVVSISYSSVPAPTVSALNPDYSQQIESITETLNGIGEKVELKEFESIAEFCNIIKELIDNTAPYGAKEE